MGKWYWFQLMSFDQKIFTIGVDEKISIFLNSSPRKFLIISATFYMWGCDHRQHRISSIDFKFHGKLSIHSGVVISWIYGTFCENCSTSSKRHYSRKDIYVSYEIRKLLVKFNVVCDGIFTYRILPTVFEISGRETQESANFFCKLLWWKSSDQNSLAEVNIISP